MKEFVRRVFFFFIPIILIIYPLDILISNSLKKTSSYNGEYEVWNDIYSGEINCDIAIYGSSRAWLHIDPEIIKDSLGLSAYNFGIDGHNFWLQYFRHQEYLRYNKPPKVIVHSVDFITLEKRTDLYNLEQFLPYMLWDKFIFDNVASYEGFTALDFAIPLVRFSNKPTTIRIAFSPKLKSKKGSKRHNGFQGQVIEWNGDFEAARKERGHYFSKIDPATIELYNQFLRECQSMGITVVLVYTPEFIEGQEYVSNREEIMKIYSNIAKEYNLVFFDYSDLEMCFNRQYFYNSSHLNSRGAEVFTRILSHDLQNLFNLSKNTVQGDPRASGLIH